MDIHEIASQLPHELPPAMKKVADATSTEIISARGKTSALYNPDVEKKFLNYIALGISIELACAACKVSTNTFYDRAKKDPDWAEKVLEARAECAIFNLYVIKKAAKKGDWKAAETLLRLTFPQTYGRQATEMIVSGDPDKPIKIEIQMNEGAWNPTGDEG